jgi:hypothetical protein
MIKMLQMRIDKFSQFSRFQIHVAVVVVAGRMAIGNVPTSDLETDQGTQRRGVPTEAFWVVRRKSSKDHQRHIPF